MTLVGCNYFSAPFDLTTVWLFDRTALSNFLTAQTDWSLFNSQRWQV